ncbi:MAG: glycerol kinase GlpK [Deltaproteobacteria bacterium]|nr:glycerol kinase GlpK [Deltaproteobacteria bacterium]
MAADYLLAIDQGTTSSRAMVFDREGRPVAASSRELPQIFPAGGWVEHDPEFIWSDTVGVCRRALAKAGLGPRDLAGIGITNQRETTLLWERDSGRPVHNALVWQDRRTAAECRALAAAGHLELITSRTGLLIDPYFSATKLAWLLEHVPGARQRAEKGELAFGTVDSYLLYRLTGGQVHATDVTNACRTLLFNIHTGAWDPDLLELFDLPPALLPEVRDNCAAYGQATASFLGEPAPILAMAGDQQAALVGQACLTPGMIKSTYGTGCFVLLNCGEEPRPSANRLLTTVAYRLNGRSTYALEGSIFVAGAAIQWLRDEMGLIEHARDSLGHAASLADNGGVYFVPAFTGLGAPHWDPAARGAIVGLTRGATKSHLVRAALEAQAYQTRDLLAAMQGDAGQELTLIRVDGGMVVNDWMCQFLADVTGLAVERPQVNETTALGVAFLAGLAAGLFPDLAALDRTWQRDRLFEPAMPADQREELYAGWLAAVRRVMS